MKRFTLSPTTREIIVNRSSEAPDDLFSYSPETHAQSRSLGNLFVVGHTDNESDTVGYLVSLIAAMAKREYYTSQPEGDSKEAFARTLRKVNEVVEEFFKTNEVGVNVGIFAITGNSLYVSRLGKFRILLAREDKVTDVLKDVSRFSKEVIQKRRFSNVISGPIQAKDRLLAYFPHLALARREKTIKAHLVSDSPEEMDARISEFGKKSSSFSGSLLMVDINNVAIKNENKVVTTPDPNSVPRLAWSGENDASQKHGNANNKSDWNGGVTENQETPNIIPTEFTHRSRMNLVSRAFRNIRMINFGSSGKALVMVLIALVVVGGAIGFKSLFFTDESAQQVQKLLDASSAELKNIRSLVSQDETRSARAMILDQLSGLDSLANNSRDENAKKIYSSFVEILNEIDRAESASITLEATVPESEGIVIMATSASGSDSIWVLAREQEQDKFVILKFNEGSIVDSVALDSSVNIMIPAPPSILLANTSERTVTVLGAPSGETTLPTPDSILSISWFIDYAYVLTGSGIMKVSDLDTKKPVTKQWLTDSSELASDAIHIAVDGDIWTLSSDGTLTKYYRGKKISDTLLAMNITDSNKLLTTEEMPFIYITDTRLKRIHIIDKENVQLIRTITIDTEQEVKDFFITPDFGIMMLVADGKIWRIE